MGRLASVRTGSISAIRRLWKDASWSLFGHLLSLVTGLVALKIISRLVATEEYGSAGLVLGLCGLLSLFISGPLINERIRSYFDYLRDNAGVSLSRTLRVLLLKTSGLTTAIYLCVAGWGYFRGQPTYLELLLPVMVLLLLQPQQSAAMGQLESQRDYRLLATIQPLTNLLQLTVMALFLVAGVPGAHAILWSHGIALLTVTGRLHFKWRSLPAAQESVPLARFEISGLGWTMYGFTLGSWIMSTADRYLIDHFLKIEEVGVYVINYALASMPYLVVNAWLTSLSRPRLYARAADSDWAGVLRVVQASLAGGAGLAVAGTILFYWAAEWLGRILLSQDYWHSKELVLILAAGHVFYVIGHTSTTYFFATRHARWVWISALLAAGLNILTNIILVPKLGLIGAAWATGVSYGAWAVMMMGGLFALSRRMAKECKSPDASR